MNKLTYLEDNLSRWHKFVLNYIWVFYTASIFISGIILTLSMEELRNPTTEVMYIKTIGLTTLTLAIATIITHTISLSKQRKILKDWESLYFK